MTMKKEETEIVLEREIKGRRVWKKVARSRVTSDARDDAGGSRLWLPTKSSWELGPRVPTFLSICE